MALVGLCLSRLSERAPQLSAAQAAQAAAAEAEAESAQCEALLTAYAQRFEADGAALLAAALEPPAEGGMWVPPPDMQRVRPGLGLPEQWLPLELSGHVRCSLLY